MFVNIQHHKLVPLMGIMFQQIGCMVVMNGNTVIYCTVVQIYTILSVAYSMQCTFMKGINNI